MFRSADRRPALGAVPAHDGGHVPYHRDIGDRTQHEAAVRSGGETWKYCKVVTARDDRLDQILGLAGSETSYAELYSNPIDTR